VAQRFSAAINETGKGTSSLVPLSRRKYARASAPEVIFIFAATTNACECCALTHKQKWRKPTGPRHYSHPLSEHQTAADKPDTTRNIPIEMNDLQRNNQPEG